MKRWQEGAKVFNSQQVAAQVISTAIKDGHQYCLLRVAVENKLTGKMIAANQVHPVRGDSLKARHTIVEALGEKEVWQDSQQETDRL